MTNRQLKQYYHARRALKVFQQIETFGGKSEFAKTEQVKRIDKLLADTLDFIASIKHPDGTPDLYVQEAMAHRYIYGHSWQSVATHCGHPEAKDNIRKMCYKYLEKE